MTSLERHLTQYAAYHRDRRNVATHFVGIPLIVIGIATLLSRPVWSVAGFPLSIAVLVVLGSAVFYVRLDARFGLVMTALFGGAAALGAALAAASTPLWLAVGLGGFVIGWAIQFVGHVFEGRKPAFLDDLVGLLVGPLFIVAELAFALGLRRELRGVIERHTPRELGPDAPRSAASP
ncbi:MAG: DUF962 domain-containing protein [Myxococcales bacterium]|nr:DUF962 domain-containing protein [Myxococcales bacterium]